MSAPAPLPESLLADLRAAVGDEGIVTGEAQLRTYESDGLLHHRMPPAVAVLPETADQVQAVVRACARTGTGWVARGAGSGLSGGALPIADGVLIVTTRMNRILEVDLENQRICVEPGGHQRSPSPAAVGPGLFYPPTPRARSSARSAATSRRTPAARAASSTGSRRNYVTGSRWCSPTARSRGSAGRARRPGLRPPRRLRGPEGTLGIATRIWLRLVPSPEAVRTLVAFFDSARAAAEAVTEIVGSASSPRRSR